MPPCAQAPGFCNAEARPGLAQKVADASAFIGGGLEIQLTSTGELKQFKAAFGNRAQHDFGSYKADFNVTDGHSKGSRSLRAAFATSKKRCTDVVRIPFTSFSNKWSSSTGEPTVRCTPEHKEVCPNAHALATIGSIGIWAEGHAGQFHLELESISAYLGGAPAPGPGPAPSTPGIDLWTVKSNTPWRITNE